MPTKSRNGVTVFLPPDLKEQVRQRCFETRRSFQSVVVEAAARFVGTDPAPYLAGRLVGDCPTIIPESK